MGFFTGIKNALNIGGAEIHIFTNERNYSQFDQIEGEVLIKGKDYEQSGRSISIDFKEFWTERRTSGTGKNRRTRTVTVYRSRKKRRLCGAFQIKPGEERSFPFTFNLSMNCRVSTRSTGWLLDVNLDIPGAIDPSGSVKLQVGPALEFATILGVCEKRLKFHESPKHMHWSSQTQATQFRLLPPAALKDELDFLELTLRQTGSGGVKGTLTFDLQERSIGDYFKAIFNYDQVDVPLLLSTQQIFSEAFEPNSDEISKVIGKKLEKVVRTRKQAR